MDNPILIDLDNLTREMVEKAAPVVRLDPPISWDELMLIPLFGLMVFVITLMVTA